MEYIELHEETKSFRVQVFRCNYCKKEFERHTLFNPLELIVYDNLFEITKNGLLIFCV